MNLPLRRKNAAQAYLPYGRQLIEEDDIDAVANALRGDFLTTGPLVAQFERTLSEIVGSAGAVACSNGTAALYMAARALNLKAGDVAIVPAITFLATASAPRLAGADIIFTDVDPDTGLMRAQDLEAAFRCVTKGAKGTVFPVHFAGQSCDMAAISALARKYGFSIIEDAAHALGTAFVETDGGLFPVGGCKYSDLTIFSFHPVKTIAMGEGGAVSTNNPALLDRLRKVRNHGIVREAEDFVLPEAFDLQGVANPWFYECEEPGHNFRIPDINCALGLSQLGKLSRFVAHRRALLAVYDELLKPLYPLVKPLGRDLRSHTAWHLYVALVDFKAAGIERGTLMRAMTSKGIGSQVHYIPVHRQPYYARTVKTPTLPGADAYYAKTLSLPLHAAMSDDDVTRVVAVLKDCLGV